MMIWPEPEISGVRAVEGVSFPGVGVVEDVLRYALIRFFIPNDVVVIPGLPREFRVYSPGILCDTCLETAHD